MLRDHRLALGDHRLALDRLGGVLAGAAAGRRGEQQHERSEGHEYASMAWAAAWSGEHGRARGC